MRATDSWKFTERSEFDSEGDIGSADALAEENSLLRAVIDNFPGGIILYDRNLRLVLCNETQKRLLEYPPGLFEFGLPSLEQIFRFNANCGEYGQGEVEFLVKERMRLAALREAHLFERTRPNGTVLQIRGVPLPGGGFLTTYLDITNERRQPARHVQAVHADPDPELSSWSMFLDRFGQVLARARRGQVAALHYIDLDHFRHVEHRLGRKVADLLLKNVADRLRRAARATDTVCKLEDDEFLILQSEVVRPSDVAKLSSRVIEEIKEPHEINGYKIMIGAALGVAMIPRDGTFPEELIAKAKEHLCRARVEKAEMIVAADAPKSTVAV